MFARIIIPFLCFGVITIDALRCYSCTLSLSLDDTNADMSCVNSPADVPGRNVITCPARMKYCTIVRNDYKNTETVSSIQRSCSLDPLYLNEDIEGPDMIYHYRSCMEDLCNSGTGLENRDDGGDGGDNGGMVVDGTGSGTANMASLKLFIVSLVATYFLL